MVLKLLIEIVSNSVDEFRNGFGNKINVSIDKDIIIKTIVGNPPDNLNTLEKIAIAINNDENFSSTIKKELDSKITEEELKIWIEENFPTLSRNEILEICK